MERNDEVDVEEETDNEPAVQPVKRPRGRPKGVKVGPRPVAWVCAAIVDDTLVHERLSAPDGSSDEEIANFSADEAREIFEVTHGVECTSVLGPFYDQKGGQNKEPSHRRETVSIPLPELTTKREAAIYKGWRGMAYDIKGRDDAVYFMFGQEIDPDPNKKKATPQAKSVYRSAVVFEPNENS